MTTGETRDMVLLAAIFVLAVLVVWVGFRSRPVAPLPPVTPQQRPQDDEVRDIRHRVGNLELTASRLVDHEERLRRIEGEVAEVRAVLAVLREGLVALKEGLARVERQVNHLVEHHVDREKS